MFTAFLITFIALIILVIFIEYHNEKRKSNFKKNKHQTSSNEKFKKFIQQEKEINQEVHTELEISKVITPSTIPTRTQVRYPKFDHQRLIKMGLSDAEVKEFILELIPQIETQIPLIEDAINLSDFHQLKKLTHHIKGSTTNIGTGGVADLLVEYDTYLKNGTDISIIESYFQELIYYSKELKVQYS